MVAIAVKARYNKIGLPMFPYVPLMESQMERIPVCAPEARFNLNCQLESSSRSWRLRSGN